MEALMCELGTLATYQPSAEVPWNRDAALHVYRRLGYGLDPGDLDAVLSADAATHIRARLDAAAAVAPMPEPDFANKPFSAYGDFDEAVQEVIDWRSMWVGDFRQNPWRAKLTLFWSNHFVTQVDVYQCPSWMWQYHDLLQRYAFGNFKTFVREVGRTPAMLVYLNGVQSTRLEPNENYARELFELFTLGEGNGYTQQDIVEAARALTGWNGYTEACAPIGYVPALHDPGAKTIFGQTGNYDYDGLIDLLFAERAVEVSQHVCRRLYRHFVSEDLDEAIVAQLAETLRGADWELMPVYKQLFASEHFLSPALYGNRVKGPLELLLGAERTFGTAAFDTDELTLAFWFVAGELGQLLLDPPDVAGWPGGRAWINANLLALRNTFSTDFAGLIYGTDKFELIRWARRLDIGDETDVDEVVRAVVDYVLPKGLPTAAEYDAAVATFKGEVPSYYFDTGIWDLGYQYAPEQMVVLVIYLLRRPEFQLC